VARVWGPLMSMDARGHIAKSVVYMEWKGLHTVRMWVKPYNPRTPAQIEQRTWFARAVAGWHALTPEMRKKWDEKAKKISTALHPLSGFNYFVRKYLEFKDFPPDPPNENINPPY